MLNDFISYLTLKAVEDGFLESLSDFCNKYVTKQLLLSRNTTL